VGRKKDKNKKSPPGLVPYQLNLTPASLLKAQNLLQLVLRELFQIPSVLPYTSGDALQARPLPFRRRSSDVAYILQQEVCNADVEFHDRRVAYW
jgi:hypothetical protein